MSRTTMLHIGALEPHPDNVREEIGDITETALSIQAHGILQPLTVVPKEGTPGRYYVIAGNRRYFAAKKARLDQVPVIIRRDDLTLAQITEIMLVENCHREDLNPMEKAEAMGRLRKAGYTSVAIAKAVGMTDATVCQYLALLELSAATQEKVRRGELSANLAYKAVKQTRARQRERSGQKSRGAGMELTWEPDHFTSRHPLARKAAALCDAREHTMRRRIGKTACGQCWETVIRTDERTVQAVETDAALVPPFRSPIPAGVPA